MKKLLLTALMLIPAFAKVFVFAYKDVDNSLHCYKSPLVYDTKGEFVKVAKENVPFWCFYAVSVKGDRGELFSVNCKANNLQAVWEYCKYRRRLKK